MRAVDEAIFWRRTAALLLGASVDGGINRILRMLGEAHGADRAWLIRYDWGFTHFWNTHEWARGEASAYVGELQGIPVELAAWLHESLLNDRPVYLADTRKMPRRARALQAEFRRQGIKSLLAVPVFFRGRLALQIGYDTTRERASWTEEDVELLRRVGRLFARRLLAYSRAPAFAEGIKPGEPAVVHLQNASEHRGVGMAEITHLAAQGDYSRVHLLGGGTALDSRSLKHWESELSERQFVRVSRSVIVNFAYVEGLDRRGGAWRLAVREVEGAIAVGRSYRPGLRQRMDF